jgi:hypothetical protein
MTWQVIIVSLWPDRWKNIMAMSIIVESDIIVFTSSCAIRWPLLATTLLSIMGQVEGKTGE